MTSKAKISAIQYKISISQAGFEDRIIDTLDRELKNVTTMIEQLVENLCKAFKSEM
jgi:hypothetical protein